MSDKSASDQEILPHNVPIKKKRTPRLPVSLTSVASQKLITSPRAKMNKAINVQQLRERVAAQGHMGQVLYILKEFGTMDTNVKRRKTDFSAGEYQRLQVRATLLSKRLDGHLKMMNKFCPDLKSMALEQGDGSNPLEAAARAWAAALDADPD